MRLATAPLPSFEEFAAGREANASTPLKITTMDGVLRYWDVSGREHNDAYEEDLLLGEQPPPCWFKHDPWTIKYVDDLSGGQTNYLPETPSVISTNKESKVIHAEECEELFKIVQRNAANVNMKVNNEKTNPLCTSTNQALSTSSFVELDGTKIESKPTMKVLGFMMNDSCSMAANNAYIKKKFGARIWTITHLKKAKIKQDDLIRIYAASIRPIIMYAAQAYHFMLTEEQSEELERLQRIALRRIFHSGTSYRSALESSGLPGLSDFRREICHKFAKKTAEKILGTRHGSQKTRPQSTT